MEDGKRAQRQPPSIVGIKSIGGAGRVEQLNHR